jgi:hypothetical protein
MELITSHRLLIVHFLLPEKIDGGRFCVLDPTTLPPFAL